MRRSVIVALVFGFVSSITSTIVFGIDRANLQAALNEVLDDDPTARRTTVALKVVDLATGEVLYDRQGGKLLTPASNLKIYTSACALDTFDPSHCYPTRIIARVDKRTRTIRGDLKLVGGGNAMLSSEDLSRLADQIVAEWCVCELQGKVIVDNSRYSDIRLGPGWMWDDQPYYFNMRVTPLMVDFNVAVVRGNNNENGNTTRIAVDDPQAWTALKFSRMLRARGVRLKSNKSNLSRGTMKMLTYDGTRLAETLKHFNHESENAIGEVLLHEIAVATGKIRPTWSDGADAITAWLNETAGLEKGSFKLVDGSGLSRYNLISADSSVKLLAFMRRHRHYETFISSLPAYSVDIGKDEKRELVRAKPGGMSGRLDNIWLLADP